MVMAELGDRERANFKRRFARKDREEDNYQGRSTGLNGGIQPIMKILAKPLSANQLRVLFEPNDSTKHPRSFYDKNTHHEKDRGGGISNSGPPISLLIKPRKVDGPVASNNHVILQAGTKVQGSQSHESGGAGGAQAYNRQAQPQPMIRPVETKTRLVLPPMMTHSTKIIDESLQWCDSGFDMLMDQSDYVVVGVLGLQGVGKSTIVSHLASNALNLPEKSFKFRAQNRDVKELCSHMTVGMDMYVTQERTIFLDSQALLSASVLDSVIRHDNKYSTDYATSDISAELQSMQVVTFMMTVCNVVIVVSDWFGDVNAHKFLKMAELLKPATPHQMHDGSKLDKYCPHIVFVQNKASPDDFSRTSVSQVTSSLRQIMNDSKLLYTGMPGQFAPRHKPADGGKPGDADRLNLFLLPSKDERRLQIEKEKESSHALLSPYRAHPGFDELIGELRRQLLSMPRRSLAYTTLSEKNWFHYAARTWDMVRKHQALSEYSRLLS